MPVKRTTVKAHSTNYYVGRREPIKYIVIHTGETGEGSTPAEGMGNWFASDHGPGARSSAHRGADTDSICTYVDDGNTAFGAPGVNASGWHLEHAGRAGQTKGEWDDADSRLILANGALAASEASNRLGIPARWLTDAELRAGNVKGFITHVQASRVLGGTHWDPGPNFPADRYMALVRSHLSGAPISEEDDDMKLTDWVEVTKADGKGTEKVQYSTLLNRGQWVYAEMVRQREQFKKRDANDAALLSAIKALQANPSLPVDQLIAAAKAGAAQALDEVIDSATVNLTIDPTTPQES